MWLLTLTVIALAAAVGFAIGWVARSDAARLRPIVVRVRQDADEDFREALRERLRWN